MENRIAIYTVLVGNNYDNLKIPSSVKDNYDYYCFVDVGSKLVKSDNKVWKIITFDFKCNDNGRLSRYPKILPHKTCLKNYDYSLYIDANVDIKDAYVYDRIEELISANEKISMIKHPYRDCVYQEAYVCIAGLKGSWFDLLRQIVFLKRKGIPKHCGLFEAGLIFRKHNEVDVIKFDELWWNNFMRYSKRDQLSLAYAKNNSEVHIESFLPEGYSIRNHNSFEVARHLPQPLTFTQKIRGFAIKILYGISKVFLKEKKL